VLLAADVGGTKTLLGLFKEAPERPQSIEVGEFVTLDYDGLVPMIREFLKAEGVDARAIKAASLGVAGAVTDQVARLTNVPWLVDAEDISQAASLARVHVINDLQAMAYSVPVLEPSELEFLQHGVAQANGNAAVIAAGTGLGEALLLNVEGRFVPSASEGGPADRRRKVGGIANRADRLAGARRHERGRRQVGAAAPGVVRELVDVEQPRSAGAARRRARRRDPALARGAR